MAPASNNSPPGKRPALNRRTVSSHAVVSTRSSPSSTTDLSADFQTQKAPVHKPHRPHVVGGANRSHNRNPSFGKNLNRLQKLTSAQNLPTEGTTSAARHHQRKRSAPSAPVSPSGSPRGQHVRWEGTTPAAGEHKAHTPMRKNYSTPALRRNHSHVLGRKVLVTDKPQTAKTHAKKSVGFELGDADSEEDWEDSTQSPESTRPGSVAQTRDNTENTIELVDPLVFVKRPYPQSRSLPEGSLTPLVQDQSLDQEAAENDDPNVEHSDDTVEPEPEPERVTTPEPVDIAARLLSSSRPSKAPPAMSSVSAMATPTTVDTTRRNVSLTNVAAANESPRMNASAHYTSPLKAGTQATSSSIEGGVSRFIVNGKAGPHATPRTDSDPNTPSSFLPHYHPQMPPSPSRSPGAKKAKATSPPPRPPGDGPPSRTQQKLWLQRNAALTTSPPDSHGGATIPSSAIEAPFMVVSHSRTGSRPYDGARGAVNGSARAPVAVHDSEAKHIRKAYEKTASELHVVQRFQSPTKNSFGRLSRFVKELEPSVKGSEHGSALANKSVKSAPSLVNAQYHQNVANKKQHRVPIRGGQPESTISAANSSKNRPAGLKSTHRVYFQEQDDMVNIGEPSEAVDRPDIDHREHNQAQASAHPILSTSADAATEQGDMDKDTSTGYFMDGSSMLLRRVWDSREVSSPG